MKTFEYKIIDELGLHARPAGLLVKKAGEFKSTVTITKGDKSALAKRLFAIMGLGVKQGDVVRFTIEGDDEQIAADELELFCKNNF